MFPVAVNVAPAGKFVLVYDTAVFDVLDKLPVTAHPMTQFVVAVMAMQTESLFAAAYKKGISKKTYWDYVYEDSMNLIATVSGNPRKRLIEEGLMEFNSHFGIS